MLSLLHTLILGAVEGITEFLPISSTAHLILVSDLLHISQTEFQKSFEIIIQLGAILAVFVLYWRSFLVNFQTLKRVTVAFIPTGVIGLLLYKVVKHYLLGNTNVVLLSMFIGGILIIAFELFKKEVDDLNSGETSFDINNISYSQCLLIGLFQAIAIIPGVSRSAATILGGLWLGIKRRTIVEFSFLLALPTMAAATGLDLLKNYQEFTSDQFSSLSLGFVVSFIVAIFSIKFLLRYIKRHDFKAFGVYRIVVAILFFLLLK
jgi:undecaprenyl-diphosphatase